MALHRKKYLYETKEYLPNYHSKDAQLQTICTAPSFSTGYSETYSVGRVKRRPSLIDEISTVNRYTWEIYGKYTGNIHGHIGKWPWLQ